MATRYIAYKYNNGQTHQLETFSTKQEAIDYVKPLHDPDWLSSQGVEVWSFEGDSYFGTESVFDSNERA
jgi:hypothetical protein